MPGQFLAGLYAGLAAGHDAANVRVPLGVEVGHFTGRVLRTAGSRLRFPPLAFRSSVPAVVNPSRPGRRQVPLKHLGRVVGQPEQLGIPRASCQPGPQQFRQVGPDGLHVLPAPFA